MKHYLFAAILFIAVLEAAHWGCVKGNPVGADVSTNANTTLTVLVSDSSSNGVSLVPQAGITVQATDPLGNVTTQTTGTNGQTVFQAQVAGQYIITVPTQGNFFQSTATAKVVAGTVGPSVSFTAQGQALVLAPITSETYGISGANISYQITYSQPSNLAEPVSLVAVGPLTQTGWTINFSPPAIGTITNLTQMNVIIPQGAYQQPSFVVEAHKMNGSVVTTSTTRGINKNYSIQTNFIANSIASGSASINGGTTVIAPTTIIGNLTFTTVNAGDASTPWILSFNVSGLNVNSGVTGINCPSFPAIANPAYNGQFSTNDGTFSSGNIDSFQLVGGALKAVTIFAPYCAFTANAVCGPATVQMPPQSINLNMSLTSAVGTVQGAVTNVNFCSLTSGSVLTLTH